MGVAPVTLFVVVEAFYLFSCRSLTRLSTAARKLATTAMARMRSHTARADGGDVEHGVHGGKVGDGELTGRLEGDAEDDPPVGE
jgi:hypothetical protein